MLITNWMLHIKDKSYGFRRSEACRINESQDFEHESVSNQLANLKKFNKHWSSLSVGNLLGVFGDISI